MSVQLPRWRGNQALAGAFNTLAEAIEQVSSKKVVAGPNMTFIEDDSGIIVDTDLQPDGGASNVQPWDLIVKPDPDSTDDNPPNIVSVRPGLIAGLLPTNWDEEWTVPAKDKSVKYAKVELTTDGKIFTGATISFDNEKPQSPKPKKWAIDGKYEFIFSIYKEGAVYRTITAGDILKRPVRWMITKNDDEPFLPYDIWYSVSW